MHSSRFMHIHSPMRLWRWIYRYLWCTSLRSLRTACILSWVIAPPRAAMRVPLLDGEKLGRCWLLQNVQRAKGCLCVLDDHWRSSLILLRGSCLWFSCFMLKSLYTHNSLMHHSMRVMLGPTNDALVHHWHLFLWVGCENITGNPCVFSLNMWRVNSLFQGVYEAGLDHPWHSRMISIDALSICSGGRFHQAIYVHVYTCMYYIKLSCAQVCMQIIYIYTYIHTCIYIHI